VAIRAVASSDRRGVQQPMATSRYSTWSSDSGAPLHSKGKRWPQRLLPSLFGGGWLQLIDPGVQLVGDVGERDLDLTGP
jgi:hypothetical protein